MDRSLQARKQRLPSFTSHPTGFRLWTVMDGTEKPQHLRATKTVQEFPTSESAAQLQHLGGSLNMQIFQGCNMTQKLCSVLNYQALARIHFTMLHFCILQKLTCWNSQNLTERFCIPHLKNIFYRHFFKLIFPQSSILSFKYFRLLMYDLKDYLQFSLVKSTDGNLICRIPHIYKDHISWLLFQGWQILLVYSIG